MIILENPLINSDHFVLSPEPEGDSMNVARKPLIVREADVRAYELRTGFTGFGDYLEQAGEITILRSNHGNN